MLKIGILREGKTPPDTRVPLSPAQCAFVQANFPVHIIVQPSPNRCFPDEEYIAAGIELSNSAECDIWMGVKEVPVDQLQPDKSYFFFSHTIKAQSHNRKLLQTVLEKRIHLVDWETLTNEKGERLIAFGRFAGMVGAHNTIYTYGKRTGAFDLVRLKNCKDYAEAKSTYANLRIPPVKIVLTGTGRVANGAAEVLHDMGIEKVTPQEFLLQQFDKAVFTQLNSQDYVRKKDGNSFTTKEFYTNPQAFESAFQPFLRVADIFINGIYWDNEAPAFFTLDQMASNAFNVQVIGDITCDIAPLSSVPSTIRPSTIDDPVYGFDPVSQIETAPFIGTSIDIMAIDNLPNELPRDASEAFGKQLIENVIPEIIKGLDSEVLHRATIAQNGELMPNFEYLKAFVEHTPA
jgi:saccharopine dehydrogenase (NAD+, L-lysine forming)